MSRPAHMIEAADEMSLVQLAGAINREHQACGIAYQRALAHALAAGDLLVIAKAQVRHGRWEAWLAEHFAGSSRTARVYMQLARRRQSVADLPSVGEAVRAVARPPRHVTVAPGADASPRRSRVEQVRDQEDRVSLRTGVARGTWRDVNASVDHAQRKLDVIRTVRTLVPEESAHLMREASRALRVAAEDLDELAQHILEGRRRR
jgi:hypothetical protein